MNCPRPEYPRPQLTRENWMNLNGEWEYATDRVNTGAERGLSTGKPEDYCERITVPFCRESVLSGIGDKEFCLACWYAKTLTVPADWREDGKRVLLHFGACDYVTTVFADGKEIGKHTGAFSSFSVDLTDAVRERESIRLVVHAEDNTRTGNQPKGKQSTEYASNGCFYTRTTGIWQTVWCEVVPDVYVERTKFYPDIHKSELRAEIFAAGEADGMTATMTAIYAGKPVGHAEAVVVKGVATLTLAVSELHLWDVGKPELYDCEITLGKDRVGSYFGMRSIGLKEGIFFLNDHPVFQRLVLDQGFYPDGIFTAPSDAELKNDILRSMKMGFNGARLHQKVFEERFLTYCDQLGYLVWGEEGNWGTNLTEDSGWKAFLPEWMEVLKRDFNHPAIIGWCPLNETHPYTQDEFVRFLGDITRSYDPTRLFIDSSGWKHVIGASDIYDLHCYEQDPEKFKKEWLDPVENGGTVDLHMLFAPHQYHYPSAYTFVSEYGGTWWAPDAGEAGWGYGETPKAPDEVVSRIRGLTKAILENPKMGGFCYTQLTDVEQEKNGIYTYDRHPKFDEDVISEIFGAPAAIEQ